MHRRSSHPPDVISDLSIDVLFQKIPFPTVATRARDHRPTSATLYLIQHGYTQLTTYQPASQFWPFQWIEGAWPPALSLLLIATAAWLLRRRAS